ncbi:MAG: hypothetical protein DCF12_11825 [Snowella sp.]|nr:MAG: hypothetical protein DCF12_11825 [Snowella sp.]
MQLSLKKFSLKKTMSFNDYQTISQLLKEYKIEYQQQDFVKESWTETSIVFDIDFEFHETCCNTDQSSIARRELMTLPILKELYQNCDGMNGSPDFWIQPKLEFTAELSGIVDYMLTAKSEINTGNFSLPILLLVIQVKNNDFERSWAYCLAALITADRLNQQTRPVYGIVTDGKTWELGNLDHQIFTKNLTTYSIDEEEKLFSLLNGFFAIATQ